MIYCVYIYYRYITFIFFKINSMSFFILSVLSILFWFFQKLADWHHEHWLNFFKHAWIIFWIICGSIGAYLISYNEILAINYLAILFYWVYKIKIDCLYHSLALIIMIGWLLHSNIHFNIYIVFLLLLSYILFDFLKHNTNNKYIKKFFQFKLQFIFTPLIYSIIIQDIYGAIITFNLIGVYLANKIFKI